MSNTNPREASKTLVQRAPEAGGGVLRRLLDVAINGLPSVPGAKAAAAKQLERRGEIEEALDALIASHVRLASAQGFLTNLGGLATVAVALPANLVGMAVVQLRLAAAIAHLRGYDVDDGRVRTALAMCLFGEDELNRRVGSGELPTQPMVVATAPVFNSALDRNVSEQVFGDLAARVGGKHLAVLVLRRVPLLGGGVGAVMDGYHTYAIGLFARRQFVSRRRQL